MTEVLDVLSVSAVLDLQLPFLLPSTVLLLVETERLMLVKNVTAVLDVQPVSAALVLNLPLLLLLLANVRLQNLRSLMNSFVWQRKDRCW